MIEDISAHKLLIRLKQGDDNAVAILYGRYAKEFYWMARHMKLGHEDAEDVVQTVFCQTLSRIASYDEAIGGGERWMQMICRNVATDVLRLKPIEQIPDNWSASGTEEPERYLEKKEHIQNINTIWESTSEMDRQELRRGRGRGPGRRVWHAVILRFRAALDSL